MNLLATTAFRLIARLALAATASAAIAAGSVVNTWPQSDGRRISGLARTTLTTAELVARCLPDQGGEDGVLASGRGAEDPYRIRAELRRRGVIVDVSLHERLLSCRIEAAIVSEMLEAAAVALGAFWRRRDLCVLLTENPGLEALACQPEKLPPAYLRAVKELHVLGNQQMSALGVGVVSASTLTPAQRTGLRALAQQCRLIRGDVGPEALELEGAELRLLGNAPGQGEPHVHVFFPKSDGSKEAMAQIPVSVIELKDDRQVGRRPTSRDIPLTIPALNPELRRDAMRLELPPAELDRRIAPGVLGVGEAAVRSGEAMQRNVMISTHFGSRAVLIPQGGLTAIEVLQAVEQLTGGTWRQIGSILVHEPHAGAERAAQLRPPHRKQWLQAALAEAVRKLRSSQRARLRAKKRLAAEELKDAIPRKMILRAAACAFAEYPLVDPGILQLKATDLEYRPADRRSGSPARVTLTAPLLNGTRSEFGSVAL